MSHPRIAALSPPYEPDVTAALNRMMPRAATVEPFKLFRTLVVNLPMAEATRAVGSYILGRHRSLDARDREIVIHRTCARCGCEYEWGAHAAGYGQLVGFSEEQLTATVVGAPDAPVWSNRESLLIRLVDELHDTATVSDHLWDKLARLWSPSQLLELLLVAGWYHAISYIANGARIDPEAWAARFPADVRSTTPDRSNS